MFKRSNDTIPTMEQSMQSVLLALDQSKKETSRKDMQVANLQSMLHRTRKELENERLKAVESGKENQSKDSGVQRTFIQQLERQLKAAKEREKELLEMTDMTNGKGQGDPSKLMEVKKQLETEKARWQNVQKNLTTDYQAAMDGQDLLREQLREKELQIKKLSSTLQDPSLSPNPLGLRPSKDQGNLQETLQSLKAEKDSLSEQLNEVNEKWTSLVKEQEAARAKEMEMRRIIETNRIEMKELKERLDEAVETCNESVEVVEVQVAAMEELEEELESVKQKEAELSEMLKETQGKLEQCERELDDSLNEKAGLMEEIRELEDQLRSIVDEVEDRSNSQNVISSQTLSLQEEISTLKSELQAVHKSKLDAEFRAQNEKPSTGCEDGEILLEKGKEASHRTEDEEAIWRRKSEILEMEANQLRGKEKELEKRLVDLNSLLELKTQQAEENVKALKTLETQHKSCEDKIIAYEKDVSTLSLKVETTSAEKSTLVDDLQKARSEISELQSFKNGAKPEVPVIENIMESSSEWAVQQLASQLESQKMNYSKLCGDKDDEILFQKNQILRLEQEIDQTEKRRLRAAARVETAKAIINEKAALEKSLRREIDLISSQLADAKLKEAGMEKEMKQISQKLIETTAKVSAFEKELLEKETSQSDLEIRTKNLAEELERTKSELRSVSTALENSAAEGDVDLALVKESTEKESLLSTKLQVLDLKQGDEETEPSELTMTTEKAEDKQSHLTLDENKAEILNLNEKLRNCELLLAQKEKVISGKEGELGSMREQLAEIEKSIGLMKEKYASKEKEMNDARKDFIKKEADLAQEIDKFRREASESQKSARALEERSTKENTQLQTAVDRLQKEADNSRTVLREILAENKPWAEKEKLVTMKLQQLVGLASVELKQKSRSDSRSEVRSSSETSKSVSDSVESGKDSVTDEGPNCINCFILKKELSAAHEALEAAKRRNSLEGKKSSPKPTMNATVHEMIDLKKRLDKAKADLAQREREIERLKAKESNPLAEKPPLFQTKKPNSSKAEPSAATDTNMATPLQKSPAFEAHSEQEGDQSNRWGVKLKLPAVRNSTSMDDLSAVNTPGSVASSLYTPQRSLGASPLAAKNEADFSKLHKEVSTLKDKLSLSQRNLLQAEEEVQNLKAELKLMKGSKPKEAEGERSDAKEPDAENSQAKRQKGSKWTSEKIEGKTDSEMAEILQNQLKEAEKELKQREDECAYFEQRAKNLEKTVERWREFEQNARREARSMRQEIELNNKLLLDAQMESEKRVGKEAVAESVLEEARLKVVESEARAEEAEKSVHLAEAKVAETSAVLAERQKEIDCLRARLHETEVDFSKRVEVAQKDIKRAEEDCRILSERIQLLEAQLESANRRLEDKEEALSSVSKELSDFKAREEVANSEMAEYKTKTNDMETRMNVLEQELSSAREEVVSLSLLVKEKQTALSMKDSLIKELEVSESDMKQKQAELKARVSEAEKNEVETRAKLDKLWLEIDGSKGTIKSKESEVVKREEEAKNLEMRLTESANDLVKARDDLIAKDREIQRMKADLQFRDSEIEKMKEEMECGEGGKVWRELRDSRMDVEMKHRKLVAMETAYVSLKRRIKILEGEGGGKHDASGDKMLDHYVEKCDSLIKENSSLHKKLELKEAKIESLSVKSREVSVKSIAASINKEGRRFSSSLLIPISPIRMKSLNDADVLTAKADIFGDPSEAPSKRASQELKSTTDSRAPLSPIQNANSPRGNSGTSSSKRLRISASKDSSSPLSRSVEIFSGTENDTDC